MTIFLLFWGHDRRAIVKGIKEELEGALGLGPVLRAETKYDDFPFAIADVDESRLIKQKLISIQETTHKRVASGKASYYFEIERRGLFGYGFFFIRIRREDRTSVEQDDRRILHPIGNGMCVVHFHFQDSTRAEEFHGCKIVDHVCQGDFEMSQG